jgi:eukaryotic-like serine/threonine-protein kinase
MLAAGSKLGPYEIQSPIGAGGMGEVYRARDTRLDRTVAIKILPQHLTAKPNVKQRFEREARAISSLQHPNICTLYDVGHQDGIDFLVMEYLEGETLADRLAKGPLASEQVLKIGVEICEGLEKAHRTGVVHRDLKPGNIMLTKTGTKLLDFGLAKPLEVAPAASLTAMPTSSKAMEAVKPVTAEGTIVGTFQYMSPEQLEGKEADERSDIFALGAVLYEMATGRRAFEGKSQTSVIAAILEREPPPISSLQPMSPPQLDRVVKLCLAKDPDERFQSAHDVKLQLEWIRDAGSQAGLPAPVTARHKNRERIAWGVAALLLVVSAVTLTFLYLKQAPTIGQAMRTSILPPRGAAFIPFNFALSPDGTRLIFVALGADGKTGLWVRALSSGSAQELNGTEGAQFPFWAPDSRRAGFFTDPEGKLKTVDTTTDAVETLCDAEAGRGGTWNRNETIVFAPQISGPLYRIKTTGGVPAPVTKIPPGDTSQAHRWPVFLPDGKHFLFDVEWSSEGGPNAEGLYFGSLDSNTIKQVSPELTGTVAFADGYLLYVQNRSLMARPFDSEAGEFRGNEVTVAAEEVEQDPSFLQAGFSVSQNGELVFQSASESPTRLVWYDAKGKELGEIPEDRYSDPSISPDGRLLAVSSDDAGDGEHFIRVYDLKRGISTRITNTGTDEVPVWSRDGKEITYSSKSISGIPIREIAADGSGTPQVLVQGQRVAATDWSSDGHLVYMDFAKGRPWIYIYSAKDKKSAQFTAPEAEGQFSPDGKWLAYTGIFVQRFPGPGGRIQLSQGKDSQPRWSRDGKQIFYMQPGRKLMAVNFDSQTGTAGTPHELFQTRIVAPSYAGFQYDVAPDGRILINSLPTDRASPLTLVTNWPALLKQQ